VRGSILRMNGYNIPVATNINSALCNLERLCGLVVIVPSYRSRSSGSILALPERGSLSLVSTIEELLERKNSGSGLESGEYGRRDPSR
jgi:hypothetical protein